MAGFIDGREVKQLRKVCCLKLGAYLGSFILCYARKLRSTAMRMRGVESTHEIKEEQIQTQLCCVLRHIQSCVQKKTSFLRELSLPEHHTIPTTDRRTVGSRE